MNDRRSHTLWTVALAGIALAYGLVGAVADAGLDGLAVPEQPVPTPSTCQITHTKTAAPAVVLLGDTVGITLTARAECPTEPMHVVLVLDASGGMVGQPNRDMRAAATDLVRRLAMPANPETEVGIVEFNTTARTLCHLANDEAKAIACIRKVNAAGGSAIDQGIKEGERELASSRWSGPEPFEALVLLSDGMNNAGCDPVLQAAKWAKARGILVATVGIGVHDVECMRKVASSPRYYFAYPDTIPLEVPPFDRQSAADGRFVISDTLSADVAYVVDSAVPPPTRSEAGRTFVWELDAPSTGEVTASLRVRPLQSGVVRTNAVASGLWIDATANRTSWVFSVPEVTVVEPGTPAPTAIATSTATATAATATPVATSTATPTATSEAQHSSVYLPVAKRQQE